MGKAALSASAMAVLVFLIARTLPPFAAVAVSIPVGAVFYLLTLRLGHVLLPEDRARFENLSRHLPARLHGLVHSAIAFVIPEPAPAAIPVDQTT